MNTDHDTIVAPATAAGGAIAVIRISGGEAFAVGDRVTHRAFGSGVVSKIQPMGGDALLEVEFETAGTKRLMMRAAGQFMKKEP